MSVPENGQIYTDDFKLYNPGLVASLLAAPGDSTRTKRRY